MNEPFLVGGFQALQDLFGKPASLARCDAIFAADQLFQRAAFHQLHHEIAASDWVNFNIMNADDILMF